MQRKRQGHQLLISAILALFLPQAAVSQSELPALGAADEDSLFLEDLPSVFSASKYEQRLSEAPASVSIVTAD